MEVDTSKIEEQYENSKIKKSVDKYEDTFEAGTWEGGWGDPEFPPTPGEDLSNMGDNLQETLGDTASSVEDHLANTASSVVGAFTNTEQYLDVADAAAAAAMNYVNKKVERIKKLWNTPCQVTIKSLLNEVAPYASSIFPNGQSEGMVGALVNKIDDLFRFLLDVGEGDGWADLAADLGKNVLTSVLTDEGVSDSIADLDAVQAFASTIDAILDTIDGLQKILKVLEPIMPLAEIIADFALTFWSGGTSAAKATNETAQQVEVLTQRLISESMKIFRKYVYNIKITMPQLLVDSASALSIADEYKFTTGNAEADEWLNAMFSDEWNSKNVANLNRVRSSANEALSDFKNSVQDVGNLNWSKDQKNSFTKSLIKNFMRGAIRDARNSRGSRNYTDSDWTSINSATRNSLTITDFTKKYKNVKNKTDLDIMLESSNVMRLSDFSEMTIRTLSLEVL